jgi:hypothetical protein
MSRSYKKPYFTDQQNSSDNKQSKRRANRAIRNMSEDEAPQNGKAYRKEYCSWNIRDYSIHSPNIKKAYRK